MPEEDHKLFSKIVITTTSAFHTPSGPNRIMIKRNMKE
jgi:hypothetical protein